MANAADFGAAARLSTTRSDEARVFAARTDQARLFTALWPDGTLREHIAALAARWPLPKAAQRVRAERLHLTLHFIGAFERERIAVLREALAGVAVEAFELRLDGAELWRNGVASLRPATVPPALLRLHGAIGVALGAAGVAIERRPWRAHVTLARRAGGALPLAEAVAFDWRAGSFVLVETVPAAPASYRVVERYPRTSATGFEPKSARSR